jgi:hypothetical protein
MSQYGNVKASFTDSFYMFLPVMSMDEHLVDSPYQLDAQRVNAQVFVTKSPSLLLKFT